MPTSRSVAFVVACLGLGVVACGATADRPGEVTGSSEQAVAASCSYSFVANWAPAPPSPDRSTCNADYPLAAWGVVPSSGACRPIKTATGFWTASNPPDDSPVVNGWYDLPPTCADVGLPANCCLYAWTGSTASAAPNEAALCAAVGPQQIREIEGCMICPAGTAEEAAQLCQLPRPSSGGCTTCPGRL
jgi:hypothetical protein